MIAITSNHITLNNATAVVTLGEGEKQLTTFIDLTQHAKAVRNPANEGVWQWTFVNAPHLLTIKAKKRIIDNILNNRSAFYNVGRIPATAVDAYGRRSKGVSLAK